MQWYTIDKEKVDLEEQLAMHVSSDVIIHIGSDAQANGKEKADFVTVVCVHHVGQGGRVYYWKDIKVPTHSLWEKLYGETERSLRIATQLSNHFGADIVDKILVHVDANPNTKYASSKYVQNLAGMVMGYGFKYVLKPDAFAASHCADHIVKNKN